jgi:hypothetical protein
VNSQTSSFNAILNNLEPGMVCYVKAFASDGAIEKIGNELSMTLPVSDK